MCSTASRPAARPGTSSRIENYLGFPSGISGGELAERAVDPGAASSAPGSPCPPRPPASASMTADHASGWPTAASVHGRAVVVATGARYRRLDVPRLWRIREDAASTTPPRRRRRSSAGTTRWRSSAAATRPGRPRLPGRATRRIVSLIVREQDLSENMSRYLIGQIERLAERRGAAAHRGPRAARRRDAGRPGGRRGTEPATQAHAPGPGPVRLHRRDALHRLARRAGRPGRPRLRPHRAGRGRGGQRTPEAGWHRSPLETSLPGVFAVGDVRSGSAKRVAAAVGEGAMAIRLAYERMRSDHVGGTM